MDFQALFGGATSIANSFEVPTPVNTILLDSGLFRSQPHDSNEILIERQEADGVGYIATEVDRYTQSMWSSAPAKTWDAYNYELIATAITNEVSSRDLTHQMRFGVFDRGDQMVAALNDYSDRQHIMATNFVESKLAAAVITGVAQSTFAGQKDLDFFDAFGQQRTEYTLNTAEGGDVDVFEQLDEISRLMGVKLLGLDSFRSGMVVLCRGAASKAFKRHSSIKEFVQYTMAFNDPANLLTQIAPNLNSSRKWELNGVVFLDVTGLAIYESLLSQVGYDAVAVPRMGGGASLLDLHTGIGSRHATEIALGENGIGSYLTYEPRFQFPGCHTEVSILPVVNQPQGLVYIKTISS